jgi:metallo-beta-lactamase class B
VGGIARLQQLTGARLLASARAAPVMRSGVAATDDPQFDIHDAMPAARVDGTVVDGQVVRLGDLEITAIDTPGHTPGAMSWKWTDWRHNGIDSLGIPVVYADSLTPVSSHDYRFSDHPDYLAAFRVSLDRIRGLGDCLLLTPHPSAAGLRQNIVDRGDVSGTGQDCRDYANSLGNRLNERLAEEAGQ